LGDSEKAKAVQLKKETRERLEAFRKQQDAPPAIDLKDPNAGDINPEDWAAAATSRKRKKGNDQDNKLLGVKLRKTSTAKKPAPAKPAAIPVKNDTAAQSSGSLSSPSKEPNITQSKGLGSKQLGTAPKRVATQPSPPSAPLGLVAYGSDDDDE
jgi:hypothetical protein